MFESMMFKFVAEKLPMYLPDERIDAELRDEVTMLLQRYSKGDDDTNPSKIGLTPLLRIVGKNLKNQEMGSYLFQMQLAAPTDVSLVMRKVPTELIQDGVLPCIAVFVGEVWMYASKDARTVAGEAVYIAVSTLDSRFAMYNVPIGRNADKVGFLVREKERWVLCNHPSPVIAGSMVGAQAMFWSEMLCEIAKYLPREFEKVVASAETDETRAMLIGLQSNLKRLDTDEEEV